jgi:hypothetical protein
MYHLCTIPPPKAQRIYETTEKLNYVVILKKYQCQKPQKPRQLLENLLENGL